MLEEARTDAARERAAVDELRNRRIPEPTAATPTPSRAATPQSCSKAAPSTPRAATPQSSSKDPATPGWLREAASALVTLSEPQAGQQPRPVEAVQDEPSAGDDMPKDYIRAWVVKYLEQVYGGAPRESHAALARVLLRMLHVPPHDSVRLDSLLGGASGAAELQRAARLPQLQTEPSMWRLFACAGSAAWDAVGGEAAGERDRLVPEVQARWW